MISDNMAKNTNEIARAPHVATREVVKAWGSPDVQLLYKSFSEYNRAHFRRKLAAPLVLVTQTGRALGDYIAQDEHGLESRIRISPKAVARGELFMLDVLLHEMCHAWMTEVERVNESGYRGHGPVFAATCNRIGEKLGLPPVGVKGRDGMPDCAYWPMVVRPEGFYPAPFEAPKRTAKEEEPPAEPTSESDESDESDEGDEPERERSRSFPAPSKRAILGAALAHEWLSTILQGELRERDTVGRQALENVSAMVRYLGKLSDFAEAAQDEAAE
jgi:hypothetical protein